MKNLKWNINLKKTALLVIDMQNDFVEAGAIMEVPLAKTQVGDIKNLIELCRSKAIPVLYTVHITCPDKCALEIAAFPHLINAGMREGTRGAQVIDALAPQTGEAVIKKHRFSAFFNTELDSTLKAKNIDTLIICGTVTNICCESTARDAFFRDYKVIFGSDICSALTAGAHNATLANMNIFGEVLNLESIKKIIA